VSWVTAASASDQKLEQDRRTRQLSIAVGIHAAVTATDDHRPVFEHARRLSRPFRFVPMTPPVLCGAGT
jgi:hypothetical protein